MATTAAALGSILVKHLTGQITSTMKSAFRMLNVATDGTQEATRFINTDSNTNQGDPKFTELHIGASNSEVQVNATGKEIDQAFDLSSKGESLITTRVLDVDDNGKIFFLNLAAGFTTTLPKLATVDAGWTCRFIVATDPTTSYIISEHADDTDKLKTNFIAELDVDATQDGTVDQDHKTLSFVGTTAKIGDWIEIETDGVVWYIHGQTADDGGITVAS